MKKRFAISLLFCLATSGGLAQYQKPNLPPRASAGLATEVWISNRTDGLPGSGSAVDPFNASTAAKLDALFVAWQSTPNLSIHFAYSSTPYQTSVTKTWVIKSGWKIDLGGSTLQLTGSLAGRNGENVVIQGDRTNGSDDVVVRNGTIDCNWPGMGVSADTGATDRAPTDGVVTNASATVTSATAAFKVNDVGKTISGTGIPANSFIGIVNSATSIGLSSTPTTNTPVNANSGGSPRTLTIAEKNTKVEGVFLTGSRGLIENIRVINSYGSWSNAQENFIIGIGAPSAAAASITDLDVRNCRVELTWGNYSTPYSVSGQSTSILATRCKITNNVAIGKYTAGHEATDLRTGGVNIAYTKDIEVSGNTFTDNAVGVYCDTGTTDGLRIIDNQVIRAWYLVQLVANNSGAWTKKNVEVRGNSVTLQARGTGVPVISLASIGGAATTNLTVSGNHIYYDAGGTASLALVPIDLSNVTGYAITNNIFSNSTNNVPSIVSSTGSKSKNFLESGVAVTGLADSDIVPIKSISRAAGELRLSGSATAPTLAVVSGMLTVQASDAAATRLEITLDPSWAGRTVQAQMVVMVNGTSAGNLATKMAIGQRTTTAWNSGAYGYNVPGGNNDAALNDTIVAVAAPTASSVPKLIAGSNMTISASALGLTALFALERADGADTNTNTAYIAEVRLIEQ